MNASKFTLPSLLAAALSLLAAGANAAPAVGHDGWTHEQGFSVYVGTTGAGGTTRTQVLSELAEHRANPVSADGWAQDNSGFVHYAGTRPVAVGKTRAQVLMELAEFRMQPVSADGWRQEGDGYSVYVGIPKAPNMTAAGPAATRAQ